MKSSCSSLRTFSLLTDRKGLLLAGATGIFKVENKSTLVVEILEATNLKAADSNGQSLEYDCSNYIFVVDSDLFIIQ